MTLRIRWLGRVPYGEALAVQRAFHQASADRPPDDHLMLLEHPHVFTWHRPADLEHVLVPPAEVGAELIRTDRGGDVTYHGPGQLVGYPIVSVPQRPSAYVRSVEQLVIDALTDLGLPNVGRLAGHPGVWVDPDGDDPRKICAIGVRLIRGRAMHGFALNVDPDMRYWGYIVPCGIADKAVTSLAREGIEASMHDVVDAVAARAAALWGHGDVERQDVAWARGHDGRAAEVEVLRSGPAVDRDPGSNGTSVQLRARLAKAGVTEGLQISSRKPAWLRSTFRTAPSYLKLKHTMRDLDLVTVCEEAGCPNIFECWADGTATFMINGERCTRACGFCLVDTQHPGPLDRGEPERVAEAVARMGLGFAVVTAVARDDLPDGGAAAFAATIRAIRRRTPRVQVELLIPDVKGDDDALAAIFDALPDVLNHNVETVPRLQRAVRPSAGYARSLSVLARAKQAGLTTKSGLIVGMGEDDDEVHATLADLSAVGVDIVTIGQYLRPTRSHLPVARWVEPSTFARYAEIGRALGIPHVEASPLTRSSYHARQAAAAADAVTGEATALPVAIGDISS
jgi:lipoyl synthase